MALTDFDTMDDLATRRNSIIYWIGAPGCMKWFRLWWYRRQKSKSDPNWYWGIKLYITEVQEFSAFPEINDDFREGLGMTEKKIQKTIEEIFYFKPHDDEDGNT